MSGRERGAALLTAMLTVTLVATLAAATLWQQWRSVEVEAADRQRVQSGWILTGALDWARLILREDRDQADFLAEPWAVPLQEARLSTFLAADRNAPGMDSTAQAGDADDVFLSGDITDLQGRLNVTSLVQAGSVLEKRLDAFRRLFDLLGLPHAQLALLAENLRLASDIGTGNRDAARASLMPQRVEQLAWLGLAPETVVALEPYVTILPRATPVNVNTAPAEVIYAAIPGISLGDAQRMVAERERQHFRTGEDIRAQIPPGALSAFDASAVNVSSSFFEVRGRLRIGDVVIEEHSVVQREGREVRTLQRERGALESFGTAGKGR